MKNTRIFLAWILFLVLANAAWAGPFRITRSALMDAPPEVIFAQANDFHLWKGWSPWMRLDPKAKNTFAGPTSGKGAILKWDGNKKLGKGRMTITESRPYETIRMKVVLFRPVEAAHDGEIVFKRVGNKTLVTWSLFGEYTLMEETIRLFVNIDRKVGRDFEKGLARMKTVAETKHQAAQQTALAAPPSEPLSPVQEKAP